MNNRFLIDSDEKRVAFRYFELRKFDSDHVFFININSAFLEHIDVEICKSKMVLLLNLERIHREVENRFQTRNNNMEFVLPEYVEVESYYSNKTGKDIYLIFYKKQNLR